MFSFFPPVLQREKTFVTFIFAFVDEEALSIWDLSKAGKKAGSTHIFQDGGKYCEFLGKTGNPRNTRKLVPRQYKLFQYTCIYSTAVQLHLQSK